MQEVKTSQLVLVGSSRLSHHEACETRDGRLGRQLVVTKDGLEDQWEACPSAGEETSVLIKVSSILHRCLDMLLLLLGKSRGSRGPERGCLHPDGRVVVIVLPISS